MNNQNTIFTVNLLAVACLMFSPIAQAKQPSEDRGNNNSAAENVSALNLGTTGVFNTAHGWFSLFSNTSGSSNTADGFEALLSNTTGTNNTATGFEALFSNTTGDDNAATGFGALFSNTTGIENTATGSQALNQNSEGNSNTAVGRSALFSNTTGDDNTAIGFRALVNNTTGSFNTAIGDGALTNSTGRDNTALGQGAGSAITTGSGNVYIGTFVTGLSVDETNTTRIRNIGLTPIVGGLPVVMEAFGPNGDGKLGIGSSSRRYKEDIKPMDKASERLFGLKPVTFRGKANVDPGHVKHYGFIAEDVAEVDSDLVVYNPDGQPETLRFDSINAMLLNEFLKEHKTVQEQQSKIDKEEATIADLRFALAKQKATFAQQQESFAEQKRQIEALASGLQRVTDQVELSRFATGRIRCSGAAPQIIISP